MKNFLAIALMTSMMVTACSQSETRVPFYQYGGVTNGGGSLGLHTLRKNETLWTVAKSYNVDLRDMLDMNKLSAPYKTHAGQRIKIPAPASYKVRSGDTLYKVSRMFDTTTTELARLNNIKTPYTLKSSQTLRLPPRHAQPKMAASALPTYDAPTYRAPVQTTKITTKIEREELKPQEFKNLQPREEVLISSPQPSIAQSIPEIRGAGPLNFIKPVGGKIISGYGPKADGLHNDGINIKAAKGDAVRAAEQGVVVYQGKQIEGYGNMVLIRHAGGYLTAYAHMDKTLVRKGEKIKRGQTIGTVGTSGNVKESQLHFEIRKGRDAINPQSLIRI